MKIGILAALAAALINETADQTGKAPKRKINQLDNTFRKSYTPAKQGQQKFIYPDGFECYALNQKSADKKHNRWKNSI